MNLLDLSKLANQINAFRLFAANLELEVYNLINIIEFIDELSTRKLLCDRGSRDRFS